MLLRLSWTAAQRRRPQPLPNWSIAQCRLPSKYAATDSTSVPSTSSACGAVQKLAEHQQTAAGGQQTLGPRELLLNFVPRLMPVSHVDLAM